MKRITGFLYRFQTRKNVLFNDGMPVTKAEGHGVGTKSICSVVNKYNGMCSFKTKGDMFILRVVI